MNTTKTAQFTPGPWSLCNWMVGNNTPTGEVTICGPEGDEHICTMDGNENNQANGNLIAAAPAMYEALQHAGMSYHHPACKSKGEYAANPEKYCSCHVQKAKAALAQAEGSNHA